LWENMQFRLFDTYLFAFLVNMDTESGIFLLETIESLREVWSFFALRS
jgi:hypothetical protein